MADDSDVVVVLRSVCLEAVRDVRVVIKSRRQQRSVELVASRKCVTCDLAFCDASRRRDE
jgi:hypothetical protein